MFLLGFACVPVLIRRSRARLIFKSIIHECCDRGTPLVAFLARLAPNGSTTYIEINVKRGKFVITCRTQSCMGLISRVCVESREHDRPICHTDSKGDYHIPNQRYCKSTTHDECVHFTVHLGKFVSNTLRCSKVTVKITALQSMKIERVQK